MERKNNSAVMHIYQRSVGKFIIFYTVSDFLVYFTLVCVASRKHKVRVLALSPMFDHIHQMIEINEESDLPSFERDVLGGYSKAFNKSIDSSGSIFERRFGRAVKTGAKKIRTTASYVVNNPGEKGLCKRAEQYRWTFLSYAVSAHPFSEKIDLSKASRPLRRALKEVDYCRSEDKVLNYKQLERWFEPLAKKEKNQLTDYIISKYNCIDYDRLISFYGSYEKMCLAFASNQGSEFDINEEFEKGGHMVYYRISAALVKLHSFPNVKDVLKLSVSQRVELMNELLYETDAEQWQLMKYLHLKKG